MKIEIISKVENGNLKRNRKLISDTLKQFEGKEIVLTIERKKKKRSNQQNRYWWACITILSNHIGYSKEEMHEICRMKFLKREKVDENTGEIFPYLISSTALTTTAFSEMTNDLIQWSAEVFQVVLPLPNSQIEIFTSQNHTDF